MKQVSICLKTLGGATVIAPLLSTVVRKEIKRKTVQSWIDKDDVPAWAKPLVRQLAERRGLDVPQKLQEIQLPAGL